MSEKKPPEDDLVLEDISSTLKDEIEDEVTTFDILPLRINENVIDFMKTLKEQFPDDSIGDTVDAYRNLCVDQRTDSILESFITE